MEFALLHPDPDDANWLRPVPPSVALAQRLHPIEREIQDRRRLLDRTDRLLSSRSWPSAPRTRRPRTPSRCSRASTGSTRPSTWPRPSADRGTHHPARRRPAASTSSARAWNADRPLIDRGVSIRTLYQHTVRHSHGTLAYVERLADGQGGDPHPRRAHRAPDHLRRDGRLHPRHGRPPGRPGAPPPGPGRVPDQGLRAALAAAPSRCWRRSRTTPPPTASRGVQHSIAKLLVEGHVDEAIARRLGMNVRTCRAHIAKLTTALGSGSRAQLGYLIAQSGILEPGPLTTTARPSRTAGAAAAAIRGRTRPRFRCTGGVHHPGRGQHSPGGYASTTVILLHCTKVGDPRMSRDEEKPRPFARRAGAVRLRDPALHRGAPQRTDRPRRPRTRPVPHRHGPGPPRPPGRRVDAPRATVRRPGTSAAARHPRDPRTDTAHRGPRGLAGPPGVGGQ